MLVSVDQRVLESLINVTKPMQIYEKNSSANSKEMEGPAHKNSKSPSPRQHLGQLVEATSRAAN